MFITFFGPLCFTHKLVTITGHLLGPLFTLGFGKITRNRPQIAYRKLQQITITQFALYRTHFNTDSTRLKTNHFLLGLFSKGLKH